MSRRLEEALRGGTSLLRKSAATSRDAIVATNAKITGQLFIGLGHVGIYLRQAQNMVMGLERSVASKPRRLQEALRARENDLQTLLESSSDAIVVTNCDRRFVTANSKGLDLFGVSETNMRKFTVDIFFCRGQIPKFLGHISPFRGRKVNMGDARFGVWTEACESQSAVFSQTLSLFDIYTSSVTLCRQINTSRPH
jgi:PAS domain-containing protein